MDQAKSQSGKKWAKVRAAGTSVLKAAAFVISIPIFGTPEIVKSVLKFISKPKPIQRAVVNTKKFLEKHIHKRLESYAKRLEKKAERPGWRGAWIPWYAAAHVVIPFLALDGVKFGFAYFFGRKAPGLATNVYIACDVARVYAADPALEVLRPVIRRDPRLAKADDAYVKARNFITQNDASLWMKAAFASIKKATLDALRTTWNNAWGIPNKTAKANVIVADSNSTAKKVHESIPRSRSKFLPLQEQKKANAFALSKKLATRTISAAMAEKAQKLPTTSGDLLLDKAIGTPQLSIIRARRAERPKKVRDLGVRSAHTK